MQGKQNALTLHHYNAAGQPPVASKPNVAQAWLKVYTGRMHVLAADGPAVLEKLKVEVGVQGKQKRGVQGSYPVARRKMEIYSTATGCTDKVKIALDFPEAVLPIGDTLTESSPCIGKMDLGIMF